MTEHTCDHLCSHNQTPESLTALGFPVRKVDKIVGSDVVLIPGDRFEVARHKAWEDGVIRLCTKTERNTP